MMDELFSKVTLHKPSELRQWLDQESLSPRKGLSQNFLIDGNIVKKIVQLVEVQPHQVIIEIGPGPGVLTQELLSLGPHIVAIEMDEQLGNKLSRLKNDQINPSSAQLEVICADALTLDWKGLIASLQPKIVASKASLRIVSNLPYHLSTAMFKTLLPLGNSVDRLIIMVQTEFAERLQAPVKTKPYGPLSVLREYCCTIPKTFKVPASCFFPRPRVESTVIRLDLIARDPVVVQQLEKTLSCCFRHRRKTLKHAFDTMNLTSDQNQELLPYFKKRAEELTLSQWQELRSVIFPS